ncbi:hypothetical protein [Gordonia aquimaris]|uniref:Uncharacterized protein n=1 Tax=Gordonia aquimaris TaxID=2984863 RepID=A0A9X3I6K3_9ACTN|nr:hypothetical protein [Gordonia aquimaris]MCX2965609.1 hypothetical protein [Gordonia aquimaris]
MRTDMSCPAGQFLDALKRGVWEPDPDAESIPSDEQLEDWACLLNAIKFWANEGEPQYTRTVEYLRSGIWEFKRGAKRLSFYDTDGNGSYTEKRKLQHFSESEHPDSDYWYIPDFDQQIRLGHAFPKVGQKTEPDDLQDAEVVREEDLEHDRQE